VIVKIVVRLSVAVFDLPGGG